MSSSNLVRIGYKKEQTYGVTPPATAATLVVQDVTYTAKLGGSQGNEISVENVDSATAGNETVTVVGNKITVGIEDGVTTAAQVVAAILASAPASILVTAEAAVTPAGPQVVAAEAPLAGGDGSFNTARFTSEQYSGTPETTESAQIRTDRQSSGQIVTGLTVNGGHSFELAKEQALEDFMESAMFNAWESFAKQTLALTIDLVNKKITRAAGSFTDEGVIVGSFIQLTGFTNTANNVVVFVTAASDLEFSFVGPEGMEAGTGATTAYQLADKLSIGIVKKSLTIEKTFLDLTNKALIYRGCLVSQMELSVEYGSLISGSFETMGNDYVNADQASEFASFGESFNPPATSNSMNGSVDMPFIATDVKGAWEKDAFCLQNLNLSLNNNLTVQNCIGKAAPEDYSPGTASISADLSSYLKDGNWPMLTRKLTQQPFALGFQVANVDGWYGFYIPALQVSFDDPSSGGANQEVSMEMSGVAKVGANGESALTIYRAPTLI